MAYAYAVEREKLLTDEGQRTFLTIKDNAERLLAEAGAFRALEAWKGCSGDTWLFLAALDRLVELGYVRRIHQPGATGQHEVYVSARYGR